MTAFGASLSGICRKKNKSKNKQELWRHEGNLLKDLDDWLPFICTKNHWMFNDFKLVVKFEIQQFWRLPLVFQFCWNSAQCWSLRPRTHDFGMDIKIGQKWVGRPWLMGSKQRITRKTPIHNGILRSLKGPSLMLVNKIHSRLLCNTVSGRRNCEGPTSTAMAEPLSKTPWGA